MTIQELIEYSELKEHDREIIRKLPDEAFEWKISDVHNKNNQNGFYGCVIETSEDNAIVAFRGSEGFKDYPGLINDWCRADFGLLKNECTDQQKECEHFLEMLSVNGVLDNYKSLSVTGHSLGGNLAVYAAAFCDDKIKNRIINIYNMDGPGFCDKIIDSKNYKNILNKIHTYIPQSSIIGRLLNHKEKTTIVKSTENSILQHNTFTWELLGDKFINAEITNSSEFIDTTLTNWLKSVDVKQRKKFIDILFPSTLVFFY